MMWAKKTSKHIHTIQKASGGSIGSCFLNQKLVYGTVHTSLVTLSALQVHVHSIQKQSYVFCLLHSGFGKNSFIIKTFPEH